MLQVAGSGSSTESHNTPTTSLTAALVVFGLAKREWNISVLDHMLDLSPHYDSRQREHDTILHISNLLVNANRINQ
jgi:hypothetical protein